jgi:NAD(P)-dependent dehydrogenase (short-subunit alcohol dehydrogenase family)
MSFGAPPVIIGHRPRSTARAGSHFAWSHALDRLSPHHLALNPAGVVSGWLLAFIQSFDEVTMTVFIHLPEFPEDTFDKVLRLNLKAGFVLGQAAARAIIDAGRSGAIVNMSSINALLAIPNSVAYAASKGGLKQSTAVMSVALAPHGIRVNAVGPGTILTDLVKESVMAGDAQRRAILARTPLGRCGEPSEVASVVSFLASDQGSYVTGQTIYPNGGRLVLNYTVPVTN